MSYNKRVNELAARYTTNYPRRAIDHWADVRDWLMSLDEPSETLCDDVADKADDLYAEIAASYPRFNPDNPSTNF